MAKCISCGRTAGFFSEVCDNCKDMRLPPAERRAARPKLSSISLVREAASQIYRHRVALSLAVILPILCSQALRMSCIAYVCAGEEPPSAFVMYSILFARLPFYVMFATICHRIVLLGADFLPSRWGLFWSVRETKFLGWLLVLGAVTFVALQPLFYSLLVLPASVLESTDLIWFLEWVWPTTAFLICLIPTTYIDGRFGLVLPATAVGNQMNPIRSWKATRGNGGAIFLALLIPILVIDLIDYLVFGLFVDSDALFVTFVRGLLYYPLIAIGIVIITVAYRESAMPGQDDVKSGSREEG